MRKTGNPTLAGRKCALWWLPLLAIFFFSCATFRTSDAVDEVVRLREKCEELQQAIEKGYYDACSKGKVSKQARIHKDFDYLFSPTKLEILDRRFASSSDPDEKEAVTRLRRFLISKNIGSKQAGVIDDILNFAGERVITVDGSSVLYRHLPWYLANEKDRDVRRKLYLASSRAFEADNVFLGQLLTIEAREMKSFGYANHLEFFSEDRFFDPEKVEKAARAFLDATDSLYASVLEQICEEQLGLELSDVRSYDMPRILRMQQFDSYFQPNKAVEIVNKSLDKMGIAFKKQPGLRLSVGQGEQMTEGTRVLPVFVPIDVRIVQKNLGGASDYSGLLHTAAMALHYSNTGEALFEFKTLGSHALREGYGYLFEFLLDDPLWLNQLAKIPSNEMAGYWKLRVFTRLYEARLLCAGYLLQLAVLEGREKVHDSYYDILSPVLKFELTERDALRALRHNDFFYVVDRLRGLFLEPYVSASMKKRFGQEWFSNPEAGRYLVSQWSGGQKSMLSAVEKELGADSLDWKPAVEEIMGLFGRAD